MNKEFLIDCLNQGLSTREIEKISGKNHRTIGYWIKKHDLAELMKFKKKENFSFEVIDSKEKAYALGFILGDGAIDERSCVEVSVAKNDAEIVEFISKVIGSNISYSNHFDKAKRRFPRVRTSRKIKDITKFTGGYKKAERHYPRVKLDFERYLLLGLFDADGCITWGRRKDRDRIWQKASFTSQLKILEGVQKLLIKHNISTVVRPKANENCYIIEMANKKDVLRFLDLIYPDEEFIVLRRKYSKVKALRLELEENGESATKRQHRAEPAEQEGVETSGDMATCLNNRISIQAGKPVRYSPNGGFNVIAKLRSPRSRRVHRREIRLG